MAMTPIGWKSVSSLAAMLAVIAAGGCRWSHETARTEPTAPQATDVLQPVSVAAPTSPTTAPSEQVDGLAIAPPDTRAQTPMAPTDPAATNENEVAWPFIRIDVDNRVVEVDAVSGITSGWLEQVICLAGTRMHESVIITQAQPSHIHAALLLIGLKPGRPGKWEPDPNDPTGRAYRVVPPEGDEVAISVEWTNAVGVKREVPVREWIRDFHTKELFPNRPWVFGGSLMAEDFTGQEVYVADKSGSIVGIVTFGDELLGWVEVLPDQVAVLPAEWEANGEAMPPENFTPLLVRLRPWSNGDGSSVPADR